MPVMQAIILAGGFGTRLRTVLPDVPKPMAPIHGKPFLAWLLDYLQAEGITHVLLSTHYQHEKIKAYFQNQYHGLFLQYAHEEQPLGTGGAIVHACHYLADKTQPVFILNGDTFLRMDYRAMAKQHQRGHLTIALRKIDDCSRYGKVIVDNNIVCEFCEKGEPGEGLINAGVYLLEPDFFSGFDLPPCFSFEKDFLSLRVKNIAPHAFITRDYFIDIGIPEDYAKAAVDWDGAVSAK